MLPWVDMHPCIDPRILRVASEDLLMDDAALWNLQKLFE